MFYPTAAGTAEAVTGLEEPGLHCGGEASFKRLEPARGGLRKVDRERGEGALPRWVSEEASTGCVTGEGTC